ncbi:hypothetical protein DAEQUDRAFT_728687 [Daedalea quercina L-15889]|uniref:Uncharacterized protein n=1 Tax=Daedalea quercina L-15889 TaxID=1314783 RepID=A0A165P2U2_9APHY|nr:hypothetical protein DAEQUDRAFT_728687 [Daedalea quercina L-15889]
MNTRVFMIIGPHESSVRRTRSSIFQDDIECMNDTWDVTQARQNDIDEQVGAATSLEEDANWRKDDSKKDLADVRAGERHCGRAR